MCTIAVCSEVVQECMAKIQVHRFSFFVRLKIYFTKSAKIPVFNSQDTCIAVF